MVRGYLTICWPLRVYITPARKVITTKEWYHSTQIVKTNILLYSISPNVWGMYTELHLNCNCTLQGSLTHQTHFFHICCNKFVKYYSTYPLFVQVYGNYISNSYTKRGSTKDWFEKERKENINSTEKIREVINLQQKGDFLQKSFNLYNYF